MRPTPMMMFCGSMSPRRPEMNDPMAYLRGQTQSRKSNEQADFGSKKAQNRGHEEFRLCGVVNEKGIRRPPT